MSTQHPGTLGATPIAGNSPLDEANSENAHLLRLTRADLRLILRTSEGFGTQFAPAQAKVKGGSGNRHVRSSGTGHAVSQHVRGQATSESKSKFCSVDEMTDALMMALQTVEGRNLLLGLQAGMRRNLTVELVQLFPLQLHVGEGTNAAWKTFNRHQLASIGMQSTTLTAILEGRRRSDRIHLHVVTCYPRVSSTQRTALESL